MNLDKPVEYFIDLLKSIHAVEAEDGDFPDMREIAIDWVNFVCEYLPEKEAKKLCEMVNAIPKMNVLLHGDYHTNNVMLQRGEPLIIDLDTLCVGHPIFELGSMYNAFLGFSEYDNEEIKKFMGFDRETSKRFWRLSIKRYIGTDDEERYNEVETKASVIGYVRLLRRTLRRMHEAEAEEKAAFYKKRLIETINMVDSLTF
jgi:thiamine kinase-like enzyme